jgi:hypothetical protein
MQRFLAYTWAAPVSLFGLLLLLLARGLGAQVCVLDGVAECSGGPIDKISRLPFFSQFAAITLGHIIFANDAACMQRLRVHERTHVKQYERWGPLFPPLYLLSSAWALLRGKHYYRDNVFEIEAFAAQYADEAAQAQKNA